MTLRRPHVCAWLLAGSVLLLSPLASPLQAQSAKGSKKPLTSDQKAEQFDPRAQASTLGGSVVEERVAQVNDQIISRSDYDRAEAQLAQEGQQQGWSEQELAEHKKDLLRDLIDQQLLLSKGKELGITGDTELVRRLDEIRKQNHLDSLEDLEKAAAQQGVSYEDFKQNIRNGIITQQVIRDQVGRHLQLTQAELQRFYDQHKAEFTQPETVRLSEILIPVASGGDEAANLATAKAKADDLAAQIKGGASFEDLAKANSANSTAAQGGDLGEFKRGALAKPLEDATFALQPGQTTAPIRTKQGYILLKVMQHNPGGAQSLDVVRPQVEEAAFTTRMQPALRTFLEQLRQNAYIDIRSGYTDTAAVPNSVKPLYSAYTPPAPKKKPHFQRTRFTGTNRGRHAGSATASVHTPAAAATPGNAGGDTSAAKPAAAPPITAAGTTAAVASAPPQKLGKKEKVRFGQAPRQTLPAAPTETEDASKQGDVAQSGASGGGEQQIASADVSSNSALPDAAAPAATPVERKTRFSDRARVPKGKKQKSGDQIENERLDKPTPDETAARQEQSAPLGLNGDTAARKKAPKPKGDKTRFSDEAGKPKDTNEPAPQSTTPSPLAPTDATAAPAAANPAAAKPPAATPQP
jgi:peptidyl-prolyl cis-trans isomerase SurA